MFQDITKASFWWAVVAAGICLTMLMKFSVPFLLAVLISLPITGLVRIVAETILDE